MSKVRFLLKNYGNKFQFPNLLDSLQLAGNLNCGFGSADLQIERIVARSGGTPDEQLPVQLQGRPSPGDVVSIQFDQVTFITGS